MTAVYVIAAESGSGGKINYFNDFKYLTNQIVPVARWPMPA
jgi:hypothetical protein